MINKVAINTADKTPIEIALGIDEDGMTTAKKLYTFLGLHTAHYNRWCKTNIIGNPYAVKDVDFTPFTLDGERDKFNPKPTKDYKLTATFAKKLAMSANNERGEEAKNYFIKVEDAMKQVAAAVKSDKLSNMNNLTFMKAMMVEMEAQKNDLAILSGDITKLDERVAKIEKASLAKPVSPVIRPDVQRTTDYVRNNVYSPTSIAKAFGLSAATLNSLLAAEGIIQRTIVYYAKTERLEPCWIITDKYRGMKYSAQKFAGAKSPAKFQPVEITYAWTPKGVGFIVSLLRYKGYTQQNEISNKTKSRTWKKASV